MATETPGQAEKPSRKRAVLWLIAVVLYIPLSTRGHLMGATNSDDSKWNYFYTIHHTLPEFEAAFYFLALFCALLLLFRPSSRVFWSCSIGLMACTLLTNLAGYMHEHMMAHRTY